MRGAILLAVLLAGCGTSPQPKPVVFACPSLTDYSAAQQTEAAAEMAALPAGAELRAMMDDYAGLRDQVRACLK